MNIHSHFGDQNEQPGRPDSNPPRQDPEIIPGKEAPGVEPPVPGEPNRPEDPERDPHPAPGEPDQVTPPTMQ